VPFQVTFTAGQLRIGVPRMDEEVQFDLRARMLSSVKRKAQPMAAAAGNGRDSGHALPHTQRTVKHHKHPHAAHKHGRPHTHGFSSGGGDKGSRKMAAAAPSAGVAEPPAPANIAVAAGDAPTRESLQQISRLRCDVDVRLRVRVPPPLSAVPGPLLSTTGGLLAKLVMQALLPSFLDLLAVDYARWAAGDSSRRTTAAGSLLPPATQDSTPTAAAALAGLPQQQPNEVQQQEGLPSVSE
jgi:hypothetical protein